MYIPLLSQWWRADYLFPIIIDRYDLCSVLVDTYHIKHKYENIPKKATCRYVNQNNNFKILQNSNMSPNLELGGIIKQNLISLIILT